MQARRLNQAALARFLEYRSVLPKLSPPAPGIQKQDNSKRCRIEQQACKGWTHVPEFAGRVRAWLRVTILRQTKWKYQSNQLLAKYV
jgi:hypothetical protein